MALADIEKKILAEAEEKAMEIIGSAGAVAAEIISSAKEKGVRIIDDEVKRALKKAEDAKRTVVIPARLEAKKTVLEEKRKYLESLLAAVREDDRERKEIELGRFLYE